LRIGCGDSRKKPVLASADETLGRCARKFFDCQKLRLGVRATRFWSPRVSRERRDLTHIATCESCGNACSTGLSFDIDKRMCRFFAHYSHRCADTLRCWRRACVARSRLCASTLP
jgi:hypothetical protein